MTDDTVIDNSATAAAGADASATSVDPNPSSAAAPVVLDAAAGLVVGHIDLPNQGDTPAAPGFFAGVAQHIHDAVVGELDKAKQYAAELEAKFNLLSQHNLKGNEDLLAAAKARDAAQAELDSLKADVPNLISEAVANASAPAAVETPAAPVIALTEPHDPTAFATIEDEIGAIKARIHALADESKALTARLADIVPVSTSIRTVEAAAHSFKALLEQVL